MFAWTVTALSIYAAMEEFRELTELPDVTETILTLIGISQGAYLGLKLPRQASPT